MEPQARKADYAEGREREREMEFLKFSQSENRNTNSVTHTHTQSVLVTQPPLTPLFNNGIVVRWSVHRRWYSEERQGGATSS